jgi:O-antigen ligase
MEMGEDGELRDTTITDGLWIIALGNTGLVGLCASTLSLLLPAIVFLRRVPMRQITDPLIAPAICATVLLILYTIDNLFNAMLNPIYLVAAGGLVSVAGVRNPQPAPARAAVRGRPAVT